MDHVFDFVFIHSANIFLLTREFNSFIFKVITDKEKLISVILLFAFLCLTCSSFLHSSCSFFVFNWFFCSVPFCFPFFLFCIYFRYFLSYNNSLFVCLWKWSSRMRKIDDSGERSKSDCCSVLQQVGVGKEGRGKRVLTFYCLLQKRNIF